MFEGSGLLQDFGDLGLGVGGLRLRALGLRVLGRREGLPSTAATSESRQVFEELPQDTRFEVSKMIRPTIETILSRRRAASAAVLRFYE